MAITTVTCTCMSFDQFLACINSLVLNDEFVNKFPHVILTASDDLYFLYESSLHLVMYLLNTFTLLTMKQT